RLLAGRHEADGGQVVALQVLVQGEVGQVRVAAADDLSLACQRGSQRAEAVVKYQHPRGRRQALFVQVRQKVLVGGIEGLQRLVGLLRLADQVEAGKGCFENRHRNWRCLSARDWSIN